MKKFLGPLLITTLVGCGNLQPGEIKASREPFHGQWTAPVSMGDGNYYTKSLSVETAMKGANTFCSKKNQLAVTNSIIPIDNYGNTSLIFSCR